MVLRTSNGAPFLVLAPPTQLRTGISVEVYDRDNPATLLAVLSETRNREWLEQLNAPGTGAFEVHALDPKLEADPTLLTYGNLVRLYLDGVLRAGFRIEAIDRVQAKPNDDADRWLKVSGRGPLAILEDAIVYPAGGVGGAPDPRSYVNAASGLIIRELIAEAQARGSTLLGVTTDFTDTDDSFFAPFLTELTLDEDIGGDLLRIATRHSAMAADVWMTPNLVLRYANTRGIDRSLQLPSTGPTVLRLGHAISELSNTEVGRITNTVLIKTPAGFLERVELGSLGAFNRREGFLGLGNISDGATIDKTTDALFAEVANPRASSTLELVAAAGATPYTDFEVGDWVLATDVTGALTKQRVRALSVTETEDGRVRYVPELASIEEELEASLERWLASSAKGTLGGAASKIAEPNALDTQGTTVIVDTGIADHLAIQPHFDELIDLLDVDLTTIPPVIGEHLEWDGANWVPGAAGAAGGGGGALEFIAELDFAADASPSIALPAGYDGGFILLGNIIADAAGAASFDVRVGPSSAPDTASVYDYGQGFMGTSDGAIQGSLADHWQLGSISEDFPNPFRITIAPGYDDGALPTLILFETFFSEDGNGRWRYGSAGTYRTNNIVDVLELLDLNASGNLSGKMVLYGYTTNLPGAAGPVYAYPIDVPPSSPNAQNQEFADLDDWTIVDGAIGVVDLTSLVTAELVDITTRDGTLLLQTGPAITDEATLRMDYELADGECVIAKMILGTEFSAAGDNTHLYLGLNDNDTSHDAGASIAFGYEADSASIDLQSVGDWTGQTHDMSNGLYGTPIYLRVDRDGLDYRGFYTWSGHTWNAVDELTAAGAYNNIWIRSQGGATGNSPIHAIEWVRFGTAGNLDPWPL